MLIPNGLQMRQFHVAWAAPGRKKIQNNHTPSQIVGVELCSVKACYLETWRRLADMRKRARRVGMIRRTQNWNQYRSCMRRNADSENNDSPKRSNGNSLAFRPCFSQERKNRKSDGCDQADAHRHKRNRKLNDCQRCAMRVKECRHYGQLRYVAQCKDKEANKRHLQWLFASPLESWQKSKQKTADGQNQSRKAHQQHCVIGVTKKLHRLLIGHYSISSVAVSNGMDSCGPAFARSNARMSSSSSNSSTTRSHSATGIKTACVV